MTEAMKPELILHIGMGKTGTTALQNHFWANRQVLAGKGVLYPDLGVVAGAHHLISPHMPKFLAEQGWATIPPGRWVQSLADQARAAGAPGAPARVLMSSELIAWASPDKVQALAEALAPQFRTRICLYLRRQDNIIMAGYNQQIKAGTQVRPLHLILPRLIRQFDYAGILAQWEAAFGPGSLIVRPYERAQFPQGDLITDFLTHVLKLEDQTGFAPVTEENLNPRLSRVALEFKLLANGLVEDTALLEELNGPLFEASRQEDEGSAQIFSDQDLLTEAERRMILDHFAPQNADIARRYLGRDDGVLFTEDVKAGVTARVVTEADQVQLVRWLLAREPGLMRRLAAATEAGQGSDHAEVRRAALRLTHLMAQARAVAAAPAVVAGSADPAARRIVIHPGLPKTGTTAIQQAFHKNHARLRAAGVLYPGLDENHTMPILGLFRRDAHRNIRFQGMSAEQRAAYAEATRQALESEMAAPDWRLAVISGEGIQSLDSKEWARFLEWARGYASDIRIVFSMRHPLDLARSAIQQNLKAGFLLADQYAQPITLRPRRRLELLLKVFDKDRVTLWDMDRAAASAQGLVAHFATTIGLDAGLAEMLGQTPTFSNPSLSAAAVEALAARNAALDSRKGVSAEELEKLLAMGGPRFDLPTEVADRVMAGLADDLAWLGREFGYDPPARKAEAPAASAAAPAARKVLAPRQRPAWQRALLPLARRLRRMIRG